MTQPEKRAYLVATVAVIIALLLWRFRVQHINLDERTQTPGAVTVAPIVNRYDVAPLKPVGTDFDWMQTTNLACDCDSDFEPIPWEAPKVVVLERQNYVYADRTEYLPRAPINPTFAVYQAPPPLTWWYEWGTNVKNEQAMYIMREDGVNVILGKYSRKGETRKMRWGPQTGFALFRPFYQQTKDKNLNGADLISDGKKFVHDPNRDDVKPLVLPKSSMAMSWG
jgi:hypothetical protein